MAVRALTRRGLLQAGGATVAAALLVPGEAVAALALGTVAAAAAATALAPIAGLPSNRDRAIAAYAAMQQYLYRADGTGLYREETAADPASNPKPYSYHWPFTRTHAGTLDLSGLDPATYRAAATDRLRVGLPQYWDATARAFYSYVGSGDKFYDDNAWSGLNLVRAQRLTPGGDAAALDRAKQVFTFIQAGWDQNRKHPAPGGCFWVQASWNRDRNTVSNAPSAELGLRLYQLTGQKATYLTPATNMYNWVEQHMRSDGSGGTVKDLYWDHINLTGVIEKTQWSYNQGTMLGASVLLYQIYTAAKQPATAAPYLARAKAIAASALGYYARVGYLTQDPAFNAIFFRNLLLLAKEDQTSLAATRDAMQSYADQVWVNNRSSDPATANLFSFPAGDISARLLDQGAMVEIYACLAWDADPASPTFNGSYDLLV